mgnify:CR=1 FL=1
MRQQIKELRKYVVGNGTHEEADGNYSITENDDHLLASIPLYTRDQTDDN